MTCNGRTGLSDRQSQPFGVTAGGIRILGLDHHPQDRLGARRPDQNAPAPAELALNLGQLALERFARMPVESGLDPHVDKVLRKQAQLLREFGQRAAGAPRRGEHLQRTDDAFALAVLVQAQQMARSLPAIQPAVLLQALQHVVFSMMRGPPRSALFSYTAL